MKKRILLALLTALLLFTIVFTGCSSGIPQTQYDQQAAQLADAQVKLTQAQSDLSALQAAKTTEDSDLQQAQAQVTDLAKQVSDLKAQYEFIGLTPAQIAEKIVKNYHETHVYSTFDMFICSDMSSEVWNMLKAQGISARVVVGNIDAQITDILQSDHAWVLAEVSPGEYLALETTGGYVVPRSQNAFYYHGWSFTSPADLKANNDLIKEYNLRVGFRNQLATEVNNAITLYNNSSNQIEADKYMAVYNKLVELKNAQETELNRLMSEISQLAKPLS